MHTSLDTESRNMVKQTLHRFVADCYDPAARRARLAQTEIDYRLHWGILAELGVIALPFGEEHGGLGGSPADLADAVSELARGLVLEPFADTAIIAGGVLASGAEAGRDHGHLERLIDGSRLTLLVGGREGARDRLICERVASGVRLSGRLQVIPYAAQADDWLIAAEDEAGRPMVVHAASSEVRARIDAYRLMDGRPAADIAFEGELIPLDHVWLEGDAARVALCRAKYDAVNVLCADAVGVMAELITVTGEYLRTRIQFGAPLATFQALQHRYADLYMVYIESLALSRAFAAALGADDPDDLPRLAFAAARVVARAARTVGHEAIQMHGGIGVTDELTVSHYNARLAVIESMLRNWMPWHLAPADFGV